MGTVEESFLSSVWIGFKYPFIVIISVLLICLYRYMLAAKRPIVVGKGDLKNKVLQYCPILKERYWPTFWAFHGNLTSVLRFLLQRKPILKYRREILKLLDGGEVALDWGIVQSINQSNEETSTIDQQTLPVLLILTGIAGGSEEAYCMHLVMDGIFSGYRPVVLNQRGCGGLPLKTIRLSSASDITEIQEAIRHIRLEYPSAKIIALGISLGGMNLFQYQLQMGANSDLDAVITCGLVWDPFKTLHNLEGSLINKYLYSRTLAKEISQILLSNLHTLPENELQKLKNLNVKKFHKANKITDILNELILLFGYNSEDEFYKDNFNRAKVHMIQRPFVNITAGDDPFVPKDTLPINEFENNPFTIMIYTSHGGHYGYLEGMYPTHQTWLDRVVRQLLKAFKSNL